MERVQAKMTKEAWQMAKRAEGAHHNGLETLPLFYGAIVSVSSFFKCTFTPTAHRKQHISGTQPTTLFGWTPGLRPGYTREHFATRDEFC